MGGPPESDGETPLPNPIRVETALSRYPVHRLAKHGDVTIDIREQTPAGEAAVKWAVSHSPGPLAYKLDTLVVNRRIERAPRPVPRVIRLGSLREVTEELGLKTHNDKVTRAFHQNAATYIKSTVTYRHVDGSTRRLEAGFTRYNVVFTGEELPDGRKADAVYVVLSEIYMQVINGAVTRPVDYDYLRVLTPAAQRFYEILSFRVYAAVKAGRPAATVDYSELCTYGPFARLDDRNASRTQLRNLHAPHLASGYLAGVGFERTADADGRPDWALHYAPGPKALAEFRAFAGRGGPVPLEFEPPPPDDPPAAPADTDTSPPPEGPEAELVARGVSRGAAADLARRFDADRITRQVDHLDWLASRRPGKVSDPAAWLCHAVRADAALPRGFVGRAERLRREREAREGERREAEGLRRKRLADARLRYERDLVAAHWAGLTREDRARLDADALASAGDAERADVEAAPPALKRIGMQALRERHIRGLLLAGGKLPPDADAE